MGRLILNCDLGENERADQTSRLLEYVDAANVCCGAHAGSLEKTRATISAAQEAGVLVGAHPGLATQGGRGAHLPSPDELKQLLEEQVGAFLDCADQLGCRVHHIKLHGSLYSAVEIDVALAAVYRQFLQSVPHLKVFALAGGVFARSDANVVSELFVDRGYRQDGSLVARSEPGALVESVDAAVARLQQWAATGRMATVDGGTVRLEAGTACVHSDSPHAYELLQALKPFRG